MASLLSNSKGPAKLIIIGKQGSGKTGCLAALIAAGYKIRMVDTDKGAKTLHSLLTDARYPYLDLCKKNKIDLASAIDVIPIDMPMSMRTVYKKIGDKQVAERLIAPKSSAGWDKAVSLMDKWQDGESDLGSIYDWQDDCVLVLDSFSTLAMLAFYHSQSLNGRLGAREEGFDYQRDVGGAQGQLRRLLELLFDSNVKCNVIIISHITWVDESKGFSANPRPMAGGDDGVISNPDGYPQAIGRALSPHMGKYFNDVYTIKNTGSGTNVKRVICTVPTDGVLTKNSVFLDREYNVVDGLAKIFSALRGSPNPVDMPGFISSPPKALLSTEAKPDVTETKPVT